MTVSENLTALAALFPVPLYVVGGAVRDYLAGFKISDYDLSSELKADEVCSLLKDSVFSVSLTSKKLGTLKIYSGFEYYEYTAFRKDSYPNDGSHTPSSVQFTGDINEDAFRRDFTVNAVYYDIKSGEFADPAGGIEDIENKIIKTVRKPADVFKEDALRILRMARLAAQTGFEIENHTFETAKALSYTVKTLAKERIRDEFEKIIRADTINGISGAHVRGIRLLDSLGVLDIILPGITEGKGIEQRADFHKYDVFEHIMRTFEAAEPEVRLAALFHDIAKPKMEREYGRMSGHDKTGAEIAKRIMRDLRYPNSETERVARLVEKHMYDLNGQTGEKKLRLFILENHTIIEDLIKLKNADYIGSGISSGKSASGERMKNLYRVMKEEGTAFTVKELKVRGNDLDALPIPPEKRGEALQALLKDAAVNPSLKSREAQLDYLKKFI